MGHMSLLHCVRLIFNSESTAAHNEPHSAFIQVNVFIIYPLCLSPLPRGHVSFRDTQQSTLIGNIQNFITKRKIRSTSFQSSTLKMTANIFLLTKLQINPGSKMTVKKRHRWNRKHEQCFQKQSFLK